MYEDVGESSVRIWDLLFLVPNSLFLLFMIYRLRRVWHRIIMPGATGVNGGGGGGGSPIFPTYFALVGIASLLSFVRCIVSITVDLSDGSATEANKILWLILRFFLLMSEFSVLIFGLAFGHLDSRQGIKRVLILTTFMALLYSSIQAYLEIGSDDPRYDIPGGQYTVFEHGGSLFSFVSSLFFLSLYAFVIVLPYITWLQRYLLVPTRRSFYVYVFVMFLINFVSTLGSALLYFNQTSGLCMLDVFSVMYFGYFAPLVYWTFLSSYFGSTRPNNILFSYNSQIDDDINDVVDYDVNAFNVDSSLSGVLQFHQPANSNMVATGNSVYNSDLVNFSRGRQVESGAGDQQQLQDLTGTNRRSSAGDDDDEFTVGYKSTTEQPLYK